MDEKISEMLSALHDGQVTGDEVAQAQAALAGSEEARLCLADFRRLSATLAALPKLTVDDDFTAHVLQQAERVSLLSGSARPAPRANWLKWTWMPLAGAAALVTGIVVLNMPAASRSNHEVASRQSDGFSPKLPAGLTESALPPSRGGASPLSGPSEMSADAVEADADAGAMGGVGSPELGSVVQRLHDSNGEIEVVQILVDRSGGFELFLENLHKHNIETVDAPDLVAQKDRNQEEATLVLVDSPRENMVNVLSHLAAAEVKPPAIEDRTLALAPAVRSFFEDGRKDTAEEGEENAPALPAAAAPAAVPAPPAPAGPPAPAASLRKKDVSQHADKFANPLANGSDRANESAAEVHNQRGGRYRLESARQLSAKVGEKQQTERASRVRSAKAAEMATPTGSEAAPRGSEKKGSPPSRVRVVFVVKTRDSEFAPTGKPDGA